MSCSLQCKKGMVIAASILILITGAFVIYTTFAIAFSSIGENTGNKKIFLWTGIIECGIILFITIIGIIAGCKANKCLITIFIIFTAIIVGVFIFVFVTVVLGKKGYQKDLNDVCSGKKDVTGLVQKLNAIYEPGLSDNFCTLNCPCDVDNPDFNTLEYTNMIKSNDGVKVVNKCNNYASLYPNGVPPSDSLISIMTYLEDKMNCSGVCNSEKYYMFSDVNKGIPSDGCRNEIIKYVEKYFYVVAVASIVLALFYLMAIISGGCLCCLSESDKNELSEKYSKLSKD